MLLRRWKTVGESTALFLGKATSKIGQEMSLTKANMGFHSNIEVPLGIIKACDKPTFHSDPQLVIRKPTQADGNLLLAL